MQVHRSIERLPAFKNAVITIGTFDGVHEGHKKIIGALLEEAWRIDGEAIIITFHPHPRKIVNPDERLQLINTLDEKIELLEKTGIHHLVVVPFTPAFALFTAEQYISDFLVARFHPSTIIIGYDHHFGKERRGNFSLLQAQASLHNYQLQEIPKYVLNELAISSTKIRNAITRGDMTTANTLLGYDFFFEGLVVEGDKLGRQLGYPTANMEITDPDKIQLGHGVYAVHVNCNKRRYGGMLSVGNRPTLKNSEKKIEVNIFDFDENIYGATLRVTVKNFLRAQEKYDTLQQLTDQLHKDKEIALANL
jgi:riboflavin kinase/FMN adenylyltransferase